MDNPTPPGPAGLTQQQRERRMETARLAASEIVNRTLRTSGLRGLGGLSPVDAVTALAAQIYRGEQPSI